MIQRFGVSGSGQDDLDHAPGQILPHAHGSAEPMRDLGDERQAQAIVVTAVGPGAMRGKAPEHVGARRKSLAVVGNAQRDGTPSGQNRERHSGACVIDGVRYESREDLAHPLRVACARAAESG